MDTARGLDDERIERDADSSGDSGPDSADAGVNDAMFDLGGDERRMHVRAYNHWVSLLKGRPYPSISDLDPAGITDFGPHSVLLDFSGGVDDPGIAYLGAALRAECALEGTITSIADVPSRSLLSRLTDHYLQIIANRAPIGFEAEFVGSRGCTTLYRGILMPFSSSGDDIDFLFGVINWKELVDDVLQATLDAELDAAVRSIPRTDVDAPVWADGPSGGFGLSVDPVPATAPAPSPALLPVASSMAPPAPAPVHAPVIATEAPGASAPDEFLLTELAPPEPSAAEFGASNTLADQLAAARESAAQVRAADTRRRTALYRALGRAHDFSLATDANVADYAEILSDACIAAPSAAPMTPVVELVFGADYDAVRLAEFATVLQHARRIGIGMGGLAPLLGRTPGGIKAIAAAARAATETAKPRRKKAPAIPPVLTHLALETEAAVGETVILVARAAPNGGLDILGSVTGDAALARQAVRALR
ncbi:PAS domain-containing protein [Sphingomonas ginsenosidivorax]|uniref:PAS domain-containing protein n=1 Tax=Sphingomonas ginsenosidivorax TaxID=862135 RepID=UPI001F558D57|nr:hypothetical protein [Sphingomonas ginsenosidivorax]